MKKLVLGLALSLASTAPMAQSFPSQPLTLIVPYAAGGSSDALARALAQVVGKAAGVSVVVENRPGGGTVIGTQALLAKPADGQTVLMMAASFVINPYLIKNLPFDTRKDFQPVTALASNPHVLVVSSKVPAQDLKGFIDWTKAQQGKASFSSFGNGSSGHLGFELFKQRAGVEMLHVPYKGSAPATMAVLSGEVDATLGDVGAAIQTYAEDAGFSVVRDFCGHGIGRKYHEAPQVLHYGRPNSGLRLKKGMVFTIEPMLNAGRHEVQVLDDDWTVVTVDGSWSAQWEHMVAVTDDGYDILTAWPNRR